MSDSFYKILEIPETASIDEIKKSYRKLSMIYHPDMNQNNPFFNMMGQNQPNMGFPVEEIFSQIFGMHGMPFQNMASFGPGQGNGPNLRVFHNGIPVNMGLQKPTPIIKTIEVPIDKILTGTTIPIDIDRWIVENGSKVFENETVYVTVPKGIDEGEIIILREKGNIAREDCKGDIKIFIKIQNDTEFKRSGLDLILEKTITVKEALCGFTFELKYITGKTYTITNNSGNIISHGYRKMIPNMGFSRDQHIGNLIIIFNVTFPEHISEEILEELKKINF